MGIWAARHVPSAPPSSATKGAATISVSGIQCPLAATGSAGSAGSRPPTSRKLHSAGALKPCPAASCPATIE